MSTTGKKPSFGEKIKGAAHVVHGLGEDVRGSVMGAFETVSGSEQGKAKEADIVSKGRSEIERGAAQMKGVAVPGSTTAGPESHVESKTGDQPEKQPAKQEVPISATAGPEPPVEGKTDQPEKQPAKQEVPGPTPAPPPSPTQSRQAEPEPSRQVPAAQTGTENVQKSGQETKAATKSPQTGDKGLIGEGADAPQGPGSSV